MMHLYRKDILSPKTYVYPKTFVFDTSRFIIEDPESSEISNNQIVDFKNTSANDLINNSTIYKINKYGNLTKFTGKAYHAYGDIPWFMRGSPSPYSDDFKKDVFTNHLTDHYLKMYYKIMMGLDFREYIFQMTPDSSITPGPDGRHAMLFEQMQANNTTLFPEASEDMVAARELDKLNRGIANSLYFNSEKYMKACVYPNIFDRVFSIFINERDFVFATNRIRQDKIRYAVQPTFNLTGKQTVQSKLKLQLGVAPPVQKYYNNTLDPNFPQVYQYYVEIAILKRIEDPD